MNGKIFKGEPTSTLAIGKGLKLFGEEDIIIQNISREKGIDFQQILLWAVRTSLH